MSEPIKICNGDFEAHIAPALGGSLLSFREKTTDGWFDWLRPAPDNCSDILQTACYPLVPFSNRISHGQFSWRGRSITLPANFPPEPHAIHGHGWQSQWTVGKQSSNSVELLLQHEKDEWPWAYEAQEEFKIENGQLHISLSITNKSNEPMPAGLGLHPFFPRTAKVQLKANVKAIYLNGSDGLPIKRETEHMAVKSLCNGDSLASGLDNVFENWDQTAVIYWPELGRSLTMASDGNLQHLVIFTPDHKDFFCVEPTSHLSGAFRKMSHEAEVGSGLVELGAGERLTTEVIFYSLMQ